MKHKVRVKYLIGENNFVERLYTGVDEVRRHENVLVMSFHKTVQLYDGVGFSNMPDKTISIPLHNVEYYEIKEDSNEV